MDELRESSLLFSLESLLETERERVQREAREAQRRREDELKRVAEMAERRRLAAQQEREGEQRRVALEQERQRLEQQHIDAMKHATVERARIEAEGKMRLVEVEQSRQHDLALARIREGQRTATYRVLGWLSSGVAAALLAGAAFGYFGLIRPAHARELDQLQALVALADAKVASGEKLLALEREKSKRLGESAQRLQSKLDELAAQPKAATVAPVRVPPGGRPPSHGGGKAQGPCNEYDPINPCLGR